ncbi:MarR family winged helix-turn-helix transcriptional regulator [Paenibacillus tarimensis]
MVDQNQSFDRQDLIRLEEAFRQIRREALSEWNRDGVAGLGASQARILVILSETGPQKASSLAEQMCITSGAVTGMADSLIDLGLIRRERSETDRRIVMLSITENGEKLIGDITEKRLSVMERIATGLTVAEAKELIRLLVKMVHRRKES